MSANELMLNIPSREMNRFCYDTGVGLIPWGPLAQGSLARPVEQTGKTTRSESRGGPSEHDAAIINRVKEIADKKGWPMSHVALAWINDRISSPIIGFSSTKRMDEALEANTKELTEEEEKYLEELYQPKAVMGFDTTLKRVGLPAPALNVR
jgi:aryl-alcohol dehydrogenase-like predicted oxidoreductase